MVLQLDFDSKKVKIIGEVNLDKFDMKISELLAEDYKNWTIISDTQFMTYTYPTYQPLTTPCMDFTVTSKTE